MPDAWRSMAIAVRAVRAGRVRPPDRVEGAAGGRGLFQVGIGPDGLRCGTTAPAPAEAPYLSGVVGSADSHHHVHQLPATMGCTERTAAGELPHVNDDHDYCLFLSRSASTCSCLPRHLG